MRAIPAQARYLGLRMTGLPQNLDFVSFSIANILLPPLTAEPEQRKFSNALGGPQACQNFPNQGGSAFTEPTPWNREPNKVVPRYPCGSVLETDARTRRTAERSGNSPNCVGSTNRLQKPLSTGSVTRRLPCLGRPPRSCGNFGRHRKPPKVHWVLRSERRWKSPELLPMKDLNARG